ncbi:hypothetical protein B0T14DRAFT_555653 [Immersiella caudata]|uniref:Uncharacterized protein n=1 Tax=Immersiella caudata TaxID=314043 RepID=A0AA40C0V3_9PEZI|nr:hypothetical protein B0T14DRAFT_555653 [Immersiella caudata]
MDSKTSLVVAGDDANTNDSHEEGVADRMVTSSNGQSAVNPTPQMPTKAQITDFRTTYCTCSAALLAKINLLRDELTVLITHSACPPSTSDGHAIVLRHKLDVQAHLITTREHSHFAGTEWTDFIAFETQRVYNRLVAGREEEHMVAKEREAALVEEEAKRVLEFRQALMAMKSDEEMEAAKKREVERVEKTEGEESALKLNGLVKRREEAVAEGERCRGLLRTLVAMESGGGEVSGLRGGDRSANNTELGKENGADVAPAAGQEAGVARLPRVDATIYRGWEQAYEERFLGLGGRKAEIEAFEVASLDGSRRKLALGCRSLTCIAVYLVLVGIVAVGGILALLKAT